MFQFSAGEKEAFFEQNFDYDAEDEETILRAQQIVEDSREEVSALVEMLSDGEMIDEPTLIFNIERLFLAKEVLSLLKKNN